MQTLTSRKRAFDAAEQEHLMGALREARRALVRESESMPRRSVTRAATDLIVGSIDGLAQLLTSFRETVWEAAALDAGRVVFSVRVLAPGSHVAIPMGRRTGRTTSRAVLDAQDPRP